MRNSPLISAEELLNNSDENLLIIDTSGAEAYSNEHIKSAILVDLNKHLALIPDNPANGGRHPLPDLQTFAEDLGNLGISPENKVVIYDQKGGSLYAARFWWMLKAVGHENVQVLNGGLQAAKKLLIPTDNLPENPPKKSAYPVQNWKLPIIEKEEIQELLSKKQLTLIDVREENRFLGIEEPIDLLAGHIPNAINIPFKNNLNEDGTFKTAEELKNLYEPYLNDSKTAVHCGSGVTACHTLLALEIAGIELPSLYVGSWSEWSKNDLPISTLKND